MNTTANKGLIRHAENITTRTLPLRKRQIYALHFRRKK